MFVTSSFAKQIVEIEKGLCEPTLFHGDLTARRDFTDVRDTVQAYYLAYLAGVPGEVYNIGRDISFPIQFVLDTLLSYTDSDIKTVADPTRLRPSDIPELLCDSTKFRTLTGWEPVIPLEQTLMDLLNYWRERL